MRFLRPCNVPVGRIRTCSLSACLAVGLGFLLVPGTVAAQDGARLEAQHGDTLWFSVPFAAERLVSDAAPDQAYSAEGQWSLAAWERAGMPWATRLYLAFDYRGLPEPAQLHSAELILHSLPAASAQSDVPVHFGDNRSTLQRIAGSWKPEALSWYRQPACAMEGALFIEPWDALETQRRLDCTELVRADLMARNGAQVQDRASASSTAGRLASRRSTRGGLAMQLQSESPLRSLTLTGSHFENPAFRPQLRLAFVVPNAQPETLQSAAERVNIRCVPQGFSIQWQDPGNYRWTLYGAAGDLRQRQEVHVGHGGTASQHQVLDRGEGWSLVVVEDPQHKMHHRMACWWP